MKRLGCGGSQNAPVGKTVSNLVSELIAIVQQEDSVQDASSVDIGVVLEVDGNVAKDASWLQKEADHSHINVAELEAVGRGVSLAIGWRFKPFTLAITSVTVVNWMGNTIDALNHVKTKGAPEMLVKHFLGVIRDTVAYFGLRVSVHFVLTTENKSDCISRVPKAWLGHCEVCQLQSGWHIYLTI